METSMEVNETSDMSISNNLKKDELSSQVDSHEKEFSMTQSSHQIQSSQTETSQEASSQAVPSSTIVVSSQAVSSSVPGTSAEVAASSVLENGPASKEQPLDYKSMSPGVYLDMTVVPILHVALVNLDRLRPEDPVQFVIDFLLRNKAMYSKKMASETSANQA